ncbi:MAG: hypothetical protein HUU19_08225 [Phycisphaerales bacterium]|nr:hypothetical protein [Phycisphaerales bacterium]
MTSLHSQHEAPTRAAIDRPRVVALHRPHSVSGVRVAGARLARLSDPPQGSWKRRVWSAVMP